MKRYFNFKNITVMLLTVAMLICPLFCGVTASAAGTKIDSDVLEDIMNPEPFTVGEYVDPDKTYEYVESTLFNEAGQEVWDLAETTNGVTVTAGQKVSGHNAVKISTDKSGTAGTFMTYFWNRSVKDNGADTDRVKIDALFASTDVTQYEGIRIWMSKPETNKYTKIQISLGYLGRGDVWSGHDSKEYMYSLDLPSAAFEGYVYITFSELKNKGGSPILPAMSYKDGTLDQVRAVNFIGFKYSSKLDSDIYFGELALYREGSRGTENSGKLNFGQGVELDSSKEYVYLDAIDFNKAGDDIWNQSKMSGFEVTTGITDVRPSDAKSSVKLHTTASSNSPQLFYWKEFKDANDKANRSTHGSLFGSTIDLNDYEGVRIWVKAADKGYSTFTIMIGKMYNNAGYYPTVPKTSMVNGGKENHYAYTLVVNGGFEGYVNIPFENFVDLLGRSLPINDLNYIAFKINDNYKKETDIYISNLQVYGLKNAVEEGEKDGKTIGVLLDPSKKYEIVPSLVFNDSTQLLWDQSKIMGIEVTAGITDPAFVPKAGKTSVKIHTTGEKSSPDIYYWNEYSLGTDGRRTHSKFWGSTDCTEYEGIRLWIKVPEDNTYSKLQIYLGQMYAGYWPSEKRGGFYAYQIELPRGGYEGYINIPFDSFVNGLGQALNAKNINFIAFKYNESGFKVTDLYISDLSLYRVALPTVSTAPDSVIISGETFEEIAITKPDGTVVDDMGTEYVDTDTDKHSDKDADKDTDAKGEKGGFSALWIIIPVGILLIAAIIFLILFLKKKKEKEEQQQA